MLVVFLALPSSAPSSKPGQTISHSRPLADPPLECPLLAPAPYTRRSLKGCRLYNLTDRSLATRGRSPPPSPAYTFLGATRTPKHREDRSKSRRPSISKCVVH